jgi:hypothetical protein
LSYFGYEAQPRSQTVVISSRFGIVDRNV